MSFTKPCKTCFFRNGDTICSKFKIKIDPEKDYCSQHISSNQVIQCELCHQYFNTNTMFYWVNQDDTKTYICCSDCLNKIGTCATCQYKNICNFAPDHSEAQYVNQVVQQGFITMQTRIKNPHLVDKHCVSCRCSYNDSPDHKCQKDDNGVYCGNWSCA